VYAVLEFARNLKVNLEPLSDETNGRFMGRLQVFLERINGGVNLRSLRIRINGPNLKIPESLNNILSVLANLQTAGRSIEVCIGEVSEDVLSINQLEAFTDSING
jgi:hypothetical protein